MTREKINKKFRVINTIKNIAGNNEDSHKTIEHIIKTLPDMFKITGISSERIYAVLKKKEII